MLFYQYNDKTVRSLLLPIKILVVQNRKKVVCVFDVVGCCFFFLVYQEVCYKYDGVVL